MFNNLRKCLLLPTLAALTTIFVVTACGSANSSKVEEFVTSEIIMKTGPLSDGSPRNVNRNLQFLIVAKGEVLPFEEAVGIKEVWCVQYSVEVLLDYYYDRDSNLRGPDNEILKDISSIDVDTIPTDRRRTYTHEELVSRVGNVWQWGVSSYPDDWNSHSCPALNK